MLLGQDRRRISRWFLLAVGRCYPGEQRAEVATVSAIKRSNLSGLAVDLEKRSMSPYQPAKVALGGHVRRHRLDDRTTNIREAVPVEVQMWSVVPPHRESRCSPGSVEWRCYHARVVPGSAYLYFHERRTRVPTPSAAP